MSKVNEKFLVAKVYKEINGEMVFMGYLTADEKKQFSR